ncbi:MAG TPA: ATP-dependent DNA helicase, partial [Proteobacteria bacterium]|nr:ATP-dependent DNA helicase [Pseudomonadota bacterium]
VLFGTHSFWSGVDVVGESLSCVIIDKLPFAPPDDPLVEARAEKMMQDGRDPFWGFQVPEAVLMLKQGLGRLLRSASDRGILAILDSRLARRRYGEAILKALPPYPVVFELAELEEAARRLFAK